MVAQKPAAYARVAAPLQGDGRDACVFHIDDTLLSNLPYFTDHGRRCTWIRSAQYRLVQTKTVDLFKIKRSPVMLELSELKKRKRKPSEVLDVSKKRKLMPVLLLLAREQLQNLQAQQSSLERRITKKVMSMFVKAGDEYKDLVSKQSIIENDKAKHKKK